MDPIWGSFARVSSADLRAATVAVQPFLHGRPGAMRSSVRARFMYARQTQTAATASPENPAASGGRTVAPLF